jgi:hypothetical protein
MTGGSGFAWWQAWSAVERVRRGPARSSIAPKDDTAGRDRLSPVVGSAADYRTGCLRDARQAGGLSLPQGASTEWTSPQTWRAPPAGPSYHVNAYA